MVKSVKQKIHTNNLETLSIKLTDWVGTPRSVIIHSIFFIAIFGLNLFNVTFDKILLILTTAVSLEAIYLAIFIQMTVNRNTKSLEEVEADIDEIQEGVEELEGEVEDISEDIEEMQEEDEKELMYDKKTKISLEKIEAQLQTLVHELESLKKLKV